MQGKKQPAKQTEPEPELALERQASVSSAVEWGALAASGQDDLPAETGYPGLTYVRTSLRYSSFILRNF